MNKEDHIWKLVIRELAREEVTGNMDELHALSGQNPDIDNSIRLMRNCWQLSAEPEIITDAPALFDKIMKRIKEIESSTTPKMINTRGLKNAEQNTKK